MPLPCCLCTARGMGHGAGRISCPILQNMAMKSMRLACVDMETAREEMDIRWHGIAGYVADVAQVANQSRHTSRTDRPFHGWICRAEISRDAQRSGKCASHFHPYRGNYWHAPADVKTSPSFYPESLLLLNPWYFVSTPALAKDYLFSDDFPDDKFLEYYPYIQTESFRMALEAAFLKLPRPGKVKTPLLVLGAENDRVFTVSEHRKTARAYKTQAILYPGMAHDMMLERDWKVVADQILSWLDSRNL